MVRKTKAEAQETRHQILDAAEQVFLQRGVARTSLQDIAEAAGVTRGAIYWHFEDKAALFTAMMDRVVLPCEIALANALAGAPSQSLAAVEALAMLPLSELAAQEAVQRVFRIAMHYTEYTDELAAVRERHQASIDQFTTQLRELLKRAQQASLLPAQADTASAAVGLFALIDGLMRHWTLAPGGFDLLQVGTVAVRAYLAGLHTER